MSSAPSSFDFDLLVIGAGSAGYNGARTAARLGLRVALVDGAKELGGLCILRGCMPSKALIAAGNRARIARKSAEFGVQTNGVAIDARRIVERKNELIADFASDRREGIKNGPFTFIHSNAVFVDPHTVEIEGRPVTSRSFLIATGSIQNPPPVLGLSDIGCLDSDAALNLTEIPKSLIILGAGAVSLEFANYFNALGTKVTILQRSSHILKGADTDVADCLRASLEKLGIEIITGAKFLGAQRSATGKSITFAAENETLPRTIEAAEVFNGLGRSPNLRGLGLENAGIVFKNGCLEVEPTQQTGVPHIFAAGDAAGPHEIVHIAIQQAEVAVRNAGRIVRGETAAPLEQTDYRSKLFVLFTSPEVAFVGLTEREAAAAGIDFGVATYPFDDHGKSMVLGETDGFVKLIARRPIGEIIGAAVIGPEASSLVHEIVAVMHFRGSAADIARMPHYHPTLSEIWTYPAEELM
ncbi:MAG TPA: dihydrolipoyl dehydrogenase [Chthoniobacterales bacterium]